MIALLVSEQVAERARQALHPRGMTGCVDPEGPPEIDYVNTHPFMASALRVAGRVLGGLAVLIATVFVAF